MIEAACLVLATLIVGLIVGVRLGTRVEREIWKCRAMDEKLNATPHLVDAEAFYVIPESIFVTKFTLKRIVPPQGGSGTAPAQRKSPDTEPIEGFTWETRDSCP